MNRTGIAGLFDFHLKYAAGGMTPEFHEDGGASIGQAAPSVAVALEEQLGLRLDSSTGPLDFLVIDHAVRPSGN